MDDVLSFIESKKEENLTGLMEFLKFESISSEPEKKEEVKRTAEYLKDHILNIGFETVKVVETAGHPIVYAEWTGAGKNAKTVLIYGHYDVQPVDPIELWDTPPFEPTVRNGKIFARGTADDKGQVFAQLKALEAHLKTNGKLPVNVKLVIEGEEEAGSNNLDPFVRNNKEMLACDTVVISDTEWFADDVPSICYALRGISFIEVKLTGPNRDLHSGTFGGLVANPIQVLAKMIDELIDENGRITIPGFYDDVLDVTDFERENFKKLPFDLEKYKKDLSVKALTGEKGYTPLERTWIRPSLDINGIKGGYTGEGAKTILPSEASAKISMRLVPNQKPEDITNKIIKYLKQIAPDTVKIEINPLHGGEPVLTPIDSPGIKAAQKALKAAFGKEPVFMREGGSIPIVALFSEVLNVAPVLMGFGLPGDNIHSPNENFDLNNFYGGIKAAAHFFDEFAKV